MHSVRTISPEELVAGMTLAEDCIDAQGNVLLTAETVITPQAMAILQQGHTARLRVWETESTAHSPQAAEQQRIEHLFRHAGNSIYTQTLRNAVQTYRLRTDSDSDGGSA